MKKINLLFVVLGLMLAGYGSASACSCVLQPNNSKAAFKKMVTDEFNGAAAVFSGKVIAAEYVPFVRKDAQGNDVKGENLVYRFEVTSTWKGGSKKEVIISTDTYKFGDNFQSSTCDYSFKVGEQYLVYAYGVGDKLATNNCSQTASLQGAKANIKILQKLNKQKISKL